MHISFSQKQAFIEIHVREKHLIFTMHLTRGAPEMLL